MTDEEKRPEEETSALDAAASEEPASDAAASEEPASDAAGSEEPAAAEASASVATVKGEAESATASSDHGDDHGHGHGEAHFAHPLPMSLLGGVLGALILLTILTVGVTAVDLGSQGNFIVAMIIATVKAALVMAYFMHMVWDSKFNVVAFTSSFLFVILFLAMSTLDRGEYREKIDSWEADQKTQAQN